MKINFYYLLLALLLLFSCKDDQVGSASEKLRDIKKKELIFKTVDASWQFTTRSLEPQAQSLINNWSEWRLFVSELKQKPKSAISAFQQKSKTLSKKATELNNNIPTTIDIPAVKSRIAILITKIRMLDLYIHLDNIPEQKIIALIPEINNSIASLESQWEEIVRKQQIPIEQGESDMIRMLDTSRAIPSVKQ